MESQHPYSVWATKSQLMGAYALYEDGKYNDAVIAADRFIQLHPGSRDVAYAYYLKAICYYMQIVDVGRDQKVTEQALNALDEVVRRFPESKYARDAKLKLDFTRDHLAGKEMEIGRYYLGRGEYLAAMNRFKRVVDNYQTTTHVPEALERLVECDLGVGLHQRGEGNAAVLGYNYPGSHWYTRRLCAGDRQRQSGRAPSRLVYAHRRQRLLELNPLRFEHLAAAPLHPASPLPRLKRGEEQFSGEVASAARRGLRTCDQPQSDNALEAGSFLCLVYVNHGSLLYPSVFKRMMAIFPSRGTGCGARRRSRRRRRASRR